ncbi:hypothetical protein [Elioraea sp.]|uniref:hypothetical protein n=1 Tax=Elioraea sp. TaxID=2185103 RepID=UPI00261AB6C6|nr:hypothetical protein [Elioraea sp.]
MDGDTNTGLHRPAADTVAATTGGTTRLTVSDSAITAAQMQRIVLPADPTVAMHAVTKQYVDRSDQRKTAASCSTSAVYDVPAALTCRPPAPRQSWCIASAGRRCAAARVEAAPAAAVASNGN